MFGFRAPQSGSIWFPGYSTILRRTGSPCWKGSRWMPRSQGRLRMSQSNLILVSRFRFAQQTLRILRCQEAKGSKIRDARVCRKFREIKLGRKNREDQNWLSFTLSDRSIRQYTIKAVCVLAFHWLSATKCYNLCHWMPKISPTDDSAFDPGKLKDSRNIQKPMLSHVVHVLRCFKYVESEVSGRTPWAKEAIHPIVIHTETAIGNSCLKLRAG